MKNKSLIRFHIASKIDNYNRSGGGGWWGGGEGKEKSREDFKSNYRTSQNIEKINVFLESLLSGSFPLLTVTVHPTSLGCPETLCWSVDLLSGQLRF